MFARSSITKNLIESEFPNVFTEIAAIGERRTMERFAEFQKHFGDNPALLVDQFAKGATIDQAYRAGFDRLRAEKKRRQQPAQDSNTDNPPG